MVSVVRKANKNGFQPEIETFSVTWALKALHQSNCSGLLLGPLQQLAFVGCINEDPCSTFVPRGPFMENPSERSLRRAELMDKHRHIIAKSSKWMEQESERELARIAKAERDAAAAEQNLLDSDENERARKSRVASRQEVLFKRATRRASRRAMNAMKKTVEIADGTCDFSLLMDATSKFYGSRTSFEDVTTGLHLAQETEDDVREFLKSIR